MNDRIQRITAGALALVCLVAPLLIQFQIVSQAKERYVLFLVAASGILQVRLPQILGGGTAAKLPLPPLSLLLPWLGLGVFFAPKVAHAGEIAPTVDGFTVLALFGVAALALLMFLALRWFADRMGPWAVVVGAAMALSGCATPGGIAFRQTWNTCEDAVKSDQFAAAEAIAIDSALACVGDPATCGASIVADLLGHGLVATGEALKCLVDASLAAIDAASAPATTTAVHARAFAADPAARIAARANLMALKASLK